MNPVPVGPICCIGPALEDRVLLPHGAVVVQPGGNGLVFSCIAAALGQRVRYAGTLGDDVRGGRLLAALEDFGVDVAGVVVRPGLATKHAQIEVDRAGGWRTTSSRPARFPYLARGSDPLLRLGAGQLQVMGLNSLLRSCPEATLEWVAQARALGMSLGFGMNLFRDEERSLVDRALRPEDLVYCNAVEYASWRGLEGTGVRALERALATESMSSVVVSLGQVGLVARLQGAAPLYLPVSAAAASSSLGAGDLLCAVATGLLRVGVAAEPALALAQEAARASTLHEHWDRWLVEEPDLVGRLRCALRLC